MPDLNQRPHIILKAAVSLDGFLDDDSPTRLVLSSKKDLKKVDELRSAVDAVLVGAETVRKDNPGLIAQGAAVQPMAVILSNSGNLPIDCKIFNIPNRETFVFLPEIVRPNCLPDLFKSSKVEFCDSKLVDVRQVVNRLHEKGIKSLLVEGGAKIHKSFLEASLADEFRLSVAPICLGLGRLAILPANLREVSAYLEKGFYLDSVERLGACCVHSYRTIPE